MKSIAKAIYFTYQWLIAGPIFVAVTFLTAIFTAIGSLTGNKDFWGYYPTRLPPALLGKIHLRHISYADKSLGT